MKPKPGSENRKWLAPPKTSGGRGRLPRETVARGASVGVGESLGVGVTLGVGVIVAVGVALGVCEAVCVLVEVGVSVAAACVKATAAAVWVSRRATWAAAPSGVGVVAAWAQAASARASALKAMVRQAGQLLFMARPLPREWR